MVKSPRRYNKKPNNSRRTPMNTFGSRTQVMNGNALKTPGNLKKQDLKYNKQGRIVSKKKSARAQKDNRLVKAGYKTEKGKFGSKFIANQQQSPKKRGSKKRGSKKRGSKKR